MVAGFLRTRRFSVVLQSIDHLARLEYDLGSGTFEVQAPSSGTAVVTMPDGGTTQVRCKQIPLAQLCQQLRLPVVPGDESVA